jgi:hypothetical protein
MSNLYRGPSIDASYQVLVHLGKRFQRRSFLEINQSEIRIAIWPNAFRGEDFFKIGQSETRIACGSHVCQWIGTK